MKRLTAGPLVYVVAVVGTGTAALIGHVVGDLGGRGPLGPFFLVILLAGWLGGFKPAAFATVLCTIATWFFLERTGFAFNDAGDAIAVVLFFVFGLLTSWLCEISHRRGRRLEAQEQDLHAGQKLLEESEERYRLLTEAQPGMVWTLRPDNTVDFVNSAWVKYTGRTLEGVDAGGWRDLIHPDDRDAMIATISTPLERGEPHEVQVRFRRHDGMYRRVLSRVVAVRDGAAQRREVDRHDDGHSRFVAGARRAAREHREAPGEREALLQRRFGTSDDLELWS